MKALIPVLYLVYSNNLYAQVFTCIDGDNVSYQETPCETVRNAPAPLIHKPLIQKSVSKPRYLSAASSEPAYARYYTTLLAKIEKTGNENYPPAAKQAKLNGSLLIQFFLKPEGNVSEVFIRESSGSDILDNAAVDFITSASPFARFPRKVLKETSELIVSVRMDFLKPHTLKCRLNQ